VVKTEESFSQPLKSSSFKVYIVPIKEVTPIVKDDAISAV
jgi:hypothetical protein